MTARIDTTRYDCGMSVDALARYAMSRSRRLFAVRIRQHVRQCPDCRRRLKDADAARAAVHGLGLQLRRTAVPADGPERVLAELRGTASLPSETKRDAPRRRFRPATAAAMITLIGTAALVWVLAGHSGMWSGARHADTSGEEAAATLEEYASETAARTARPPGTNEADDRSDDGKALNTADVPAELADALRPFMDPDTEITLLENGLLIRAGSPRERDRLANLVPSLWETAAPCGACGTPEIMTSTLSDTAEQEPEQDAVRRFLTQELPRRHIPVPEPLSGHWVIVTWQVRQA